MTVFPALPGSARTANMLITLIGFVLQVQGGANQTLSFSELPSLSEIYFAGGSTTWQRIQSEAAARVRERFLAKADDFVRRLKRLSGPEQIALEVAFVRGASRGLKEYDIPSPEQDYSKLDLLRIRLGKPPLISQNFSQFSFVTMGANGEFEISSGYRFGGRGMGYPLPFFEHTKAAAKIALSSARAGEFVLPTVR